MKFHQPVALGSVVLPKCPYGLEGLFTSQSIFCEVNKSAWIEKTCRKMREHDFPKMMSCFFEFRWTSDNPKSTVALSNHAYGLCRTLLATHCLQGH